MIAHSGSRTREDSGMSAMKTQALILQTAEPGLRQKSAQNLRENWQRSQTCVLKLS